MTTVTPASPAAALAISLAMASAAVIAQTAEAPPPVQLDTVSVNLKRDTSILPYARMNELLSGLQRHGQGLFKLDFRVNAKDPAIISQAKLAIQHADFITPIRVAADGRFELPVLPQAQAKEADLATNLSRGNAGISATIQLTTAPQDLDMAMVRRVTATARKLRSELLPWYLRFLFPQIEGVRVCSAAPDWELEWRENGQLLGLPLGADPKDRDPDTAKGAKSKPCTTLTGQEQWPDSARLLAPADARLSVRLAKLN